MALFEGGLRMMGMLSLSFRNVVMVVLVLVWVRSSRCGSTVFVQNIRLIL